MAHNISELDNDWLLYLSSTPKERREICETVLIGKYIITCIFSIAVAVGILYGLYKGWF